MAASMMKKRRSLESGHRRKFLLVIDDSEEVNAALYYSASRVKHAGGSIVMLYVIEPQVFQHWMGVREIRLEEETAKAKALFRLYRRKLNQAGYEDVATEEVIREGQEADEIVRIIEEDEDISVLVLGAATGADGPGPLVASLASGAAGSFRVPVTVVPGDLTLEEIQTLA